MSGTHDRDALVMSQGVTLRTAADISTRCSSFARTSIAFLEAHSWTPGRTSQPAKTPPQATEWRLATNSSKSSRRILRHHLHLYRGQSSVADEFVERARLMPSWAAASGTLSSKASMDTPDLSWGRRRRDAVVVDSTLAVTVVMAISRATQSHRMSHQRPHQTRKPGPGAGGHRRRLTGCGSR